VGAHDAAPLEALDAAFDAAMSAGDLDALRTLAAADFVYTHAGGERQSRAEFLEAQAARRVRSTRRVFGIVTEVHADFALTFGETEIVYTTGRSPHLLRYTRVYRRSKTGWQLASHCGIEDA
jgi:ketosteroid isomerase-like protein